MRLQKLHDPAAGPLRVAGLMSGAGTNLRKILEHQRRIESRDGVSPYELVVLFTDRAGSEAVRLGAEYDLPVIMRDLEAFCRRRGVSRGDLDARRSFDEQTVRALNPYDAKVAVYAGYMSIATRPLLEAFMGINVHPADLSIEDGSGVRKFTGAHPVRDAIASGETTIAASTHLVEDRVDQGRLLMISSPVEIVIDPRWDLDDPEDLRKAEAFNQGRLKERGDWIVFPRTLEDLARGRFSQDPSGNLYYEGRPIPHGLKLDQCRNAR